MLTSLLLAGCLSPIQLSVGSEDTGQTGQNTVDTGTSSADSGSTSLDTGSEADTGHTDTGSPATDADGDGYNSDVDCNDDDPDIHPMQFDDCDGVDDDCNDIIDDATDCPCPVNWHGDHAYLFCEDRSNWDQAREACQAVGYDLVSIGTEDENDWLHETSGVLSGQTWWTGLNDRDEEGVFRWVSGQPLTYTNWADGEPNDYWSGEDCAPIQSADDQKWNDTPCDDENRFVCEAG